VPAPATILVGLTRITWPVVRTPRRTMSRPRPTHDLSSHLIEPGPTADPGDLALDWAALFGNDRPVELEVGSGKGLFLANAARANPGHNFFGIELARKYARLAAERLARQDIANAKVWSGDARDVLARRRGPRLFPGPLVEEATQETPGLYRRPGRPARTGDRAGGGASRRERRGGLLRDHPRAHRGSSSFSRTARHRAQGPRARTRLSD
jgi:hypothetical protein